MNLPLVIVLAVLVPSVLTAIGLIQINNFERKVLAFVTENRTVGQRYIYDYDVDNHRKVEIFLTGEPLSEAERETLLASAERNGIPKESITFSEHSFGKGLNDELETMVQGIYERSDLEVARKDEQIRALEQQVAALRGAEIPYQQLLKEARFRYPGITELTLGKGAAVVSDTVAARDRIIVLAVTQKPMTEKERQDLTEWIRIRLADDSVVVLNRTGDYK